MQQTAAPLWALLTGCSSGQAFAPVQAPSVSCNLLQATSTCSAMGCWTGICSRMVSHGLQETLPWASPLAAGKPPPPPSSLTLVPARPLYFLTHFSQLPCPVFYPHTNPLLAQGYHICRLAKRRICSVKEITSLTAKRSLHTHTHTNA